MNLLSIPSFIGDSIKEGFFGIFLFIDGIVYSWVCSTFKIFSALAGARLFTNSMYSSIANAIYFIIGVVMLFVLSYAILKGVIDPDQMSKGEMSGEKMFKKVLFAIIGMALTPVIFNLLYQAQGIIIDEQIIYKIIFRSTAYDESSYSVNTPVFDGEGNQTGETTISTQFVADEEINKLGGNYTAMIVWQAFFRPANDRMESQDFAGFNKAADEIIGDYSDYYFTKAKSWGLVSLVSTGLAAIGVAALWAADAVSAGTLTFVAVAGTAAIASGVAATSNVANGVGEIGKNLSLNEAYLAAAASGDFGQFGVFVPNIVEEGEVSYSLLLSTIAGGFIVYSFISFSIDMGVRAAKLAYYQIIAPVPLIMQIIPKFQSNFKSYTKSVFSTFLEVIVRILVIYIVIYLICHLSDLFAGLDLANSNTPLTAVEQIFGIAFMIIGLILFTKEAPKIITSALGIQGGNLKFGIGEKLARGEVFTAGAALGSMVTAGVRNARNTWDSTEGGFAKRFGKSALSSVGGVGGAATRSVRDRIRGGKDGFVKNPHDMRQRAGQVAVETTEKREQRKAWNEKYAYDSEGNKREAIDRFIYGHAEDIHDAVSVWSTGSISTESMDKRISHLNTMAGIHENNRGKTAKLSRTVGIASQRLDDLNNEKIERFDEAGYEAAKNFAVENLRRTNPHATAAQIKAAADAIKKEDFMLSDDDYRKMTDSLSKRRNTAQKLYEAVQDLGEDGLALHKKDPVMQNTLQQAITANITGLRENMNLKLDEEAKKELTDLIRGQTGLTGAALKSHIDSLGISTYGDLMKYVGVDLNTGKIEYDHIQGTARTGVFKISYDDGRDDEFRKVEYSDKGDIVRVDDGTGVMIDYSSFLSKITDEDHVSNVDGLSTLKLISQVAKKQATSETNKSEYLKAKARQQEQREKENKK